MTKFSSNQILLRKIYAKNEKNSEFCQYAINELIMSCGDIILYLFVVVSRLLVAPKILVKTGNVDVRELFL